MLVKARRFHSRLVAEYALALTIVGTKGGEDAAYEDGLERP